MVAVPQRVPRAASYALSDPIAPPKPLWASADWSSYPMNLSGAIRNRLMKQRSTPSHALATSTTIGSTFPRRLIANVAVPNTPLVSRAIEYVRDYSEPYLFNHVMRSWLFAATLAEFRGVPYDPEVLAVSLLLHDLGLAEAFSGPLRFEVESANAARAFARKEGLDERRAQLIWDSVALNSTPSIGLHKESEVALCTMGIGVDWGGGWCYDSIDDHRMKSIVEAFPRLKMKERFTRTICGIVESRPETTYDNFARDFGERFIPGYRRPSLVDSLLNSPFEE
nr:hypothetical protein [Dyella humicola]